MTVSSSILITQCLQNDFVKPLEPGESLPNRLHIGYREARRLNGETPDTGPINRVIRWANAESPGNLTTIHIRDWHTHSDRSQQSHLNVFGDHCIAGTSGAEFIFSSPEAGEGGQTIVVNATTLNDFTRGAKLDSILDPIITRHTRIGLMGVWTEAKITFLAYELITRYPEVTVAVCSALTASSSTANHFIALAQLEKLLHVQLIHSVGEFIEFLGGAEQEASFTGTGSNVLTIEGENNLEGDDEPLVRYLFRDCRSLSIRQLAGGFSGAKVMAVKSVDINGHQQAPHVVKLGYRDLIGAERVAFERIEAVLGNAAPQIADFADYGQRGALKYRYASMGGEVARTFQSLYEKGAPQSVIDAIIDTVFDDRLGRLYRAATMESVDLLTYYQFSADKAKAVAAQVAMVIDGSLDGATLTFPEGVVTPNVIRFYDTTLPKLTPFPVMEVPEAYLHGDLNGANIIVDDRDNVWLIDFFHTHRGHVLKDLIKLENDLLYIFTPIENDTDRKDARVVSDTLARITDLAAPLPADHELALTSPPLIRAWRTVQKLRSFYPSLINGANDPLQLFIGQLRYGVHTLFFDESTKEQKRWALYSVGLLSAQIARRLQGESMR